MDYKKLVLLLGLLGLTMLLYSQDRRFEAALVAGANFTQIDGDDAAGYNHFGLRGGLRVNTILNERMYILLEILYSERGSKAGANDTNFDLDITANFIEVPILFTYKDWEIEGEDYYKVHAHGGLVYSRLFGGSAEGLAAPSDEVFDDFAENAIGIALGASFFATKNISIGCRYQNNLNFLYNGSELGTTLKNLREYYFSADVAYRF